MGVDSTSNLGLPYTSVDFQACKNVFILVSQAAVSVRDAAGAVREVAQNILKVLNLKTYDDKLNHSLERP